METNVQLLNDEIKSGIFIIPEHRKMYSNDQKWCLRKQTIKQQQKPIMGRSWEWERPPDSQVGLNWATFAFLVLTNVFHKREHYRLYNSHIQYKCESDEQVL